MRLSQLSIRNYRSIASLEDVRISRLQALVGPNNAGKSNLLKALDVLLTAGAGGTSSGHFLNPVEPIVITAVFDELTPSERRAFRQYLLGGQLILQKQLSNDTDPRTGRARVAAEYHGYRAKPKDRWLSPESVVEDHGSRPRWQEVGAEHGLEDFWPEGGGGTRKAYEDACAAYIDAHPEIEYDEPQLGETQALGLQPVLLARLPRFYLLPAITDYSSEIDRRATTTVFRRLMADLADRVLRADPRYSEVEGHLEAIRVLLNPVEDAGAERLASLSETEEKLLERISGLMPAVRAVKLSVDVDESRELFARGVGLRIDDGVVTDVTEKGHGLQRSVVFGLLQVLIQHQKDAVSVDGDGPPSIILAIEEPELYIHPQVQRLIYRVLSRFSESDQVIYTTHAPAFVDAYEYENIGLVQKHDVTTGTEIHQCLEDPIPDRNERGRFKFFSGFDLAKNEMFFADHIVLVEGPEDRIALVAAGRQLGLFEDLPEEAGVTIVVADGKGELPKLACILSAFGLSFRAVVEMDGRDEQDQQNRALLDSCGPSGCVLPNGLETCCGLDHHFSGVPATKEFFKDEGAVTEKLLDVARFVFEPAITARHPN